MKQITKAEYNTIMSVRPGLPSMSNKPTTIVGYRMAHTLLESMIKNGQFKITKGIGKSSRSCPTSLRVDIEHVFGRDGGKNYFGCEHYISKGDVYCALYDLGFTNLKPVLRHNGPCEHYATNSNFKYNSHTPILSQLSCTQVSTIKNLLTEEILIAKLHIDFKLYESLYVK